MKAELLPINILLICIALFSNTFGQVPLNGFCRFHEVTVPAGYEKIFATDFSGDGYRDIIAYNHSDKKYTALTFDQKSKNFKGSERYSSLSITDFHVLGEDEKGARKYVLTSRKERIAGLISFSKSGSFSITSKIKFDSYPNNIDASDVDKDGRYEFLVSGPAFKGISVIGESKRGMIRNDLSTNRAFRYSSFIDLDYDSYEDIAAVDLFSNTIKFYYNDRSGGFGGERSINLGESISGFKTMDVNLDRFNDLVYIKNRKLEIILGDSVSSFQKKIKINSDLPVDEYSIFDFNGDGYNDIAMLNIDEGILSIMFAENSDNFFPPFILFNRKGIVDITSYVDRGGRKLCVLDKNGKVYLIDKVIGYDDDLRISAGLKPALIGMFNYLNDSSPDFYMIDNSDRQLKLFLSARSNLFDKYFSLRLSGIYDKVAVDETLPAEKTFYCYSNSGRVIEIIKADFYNENFTRKILYADGLIEDLKLVADNSRNGQNIHLLIKNGGKLFSQYFEFRDFRYLKSALDSISTNVEGAILSFNPSKEIYFFTRYGNMLYLNKASSKLEKENAVNILSYKLDDSKKSDYELNYFSAQATGVNPVIAFVNSDEGANLSILTKGNFKTIQLNNFVPSIGYMRFLNYRTGSELFLYDKYLGKIKKISWGNNFLNYFDNDIFESKTINSYIVAPFINKRKLLIYTDSADNLIKFKIVQ